MRQPKLLVLFVAAVLAVGLAIGFLTAPGEWYVSLQKPSFNPPNWVFGPAWTILYLLIGIAGYRIWLARADGTAAKLWFAQMALNFAWSPVFFGLHLTGLALAIIALLLLAIIAFIVAAWRQDRAAALLFVPYAAWVAFATCLNAAIVALN